MEKYCISCRYFGMATTRCLAPVILKRTAKTNVVLGSMANPKTLNAYYQRRFWYPIAVLLNICGRGGRWYDVHKKEHAAII